MSGYMCLKKEKVDLKIIANRIHTLLLPYVFWNVIYLFVESARNGNISNFFSILVKQDMIISPCNYPTWYLLTVFLFISQTPLIYYCFQKKCFAVVIVILSLFVNILGWQIGQEILMEIKWCGAYLIRMSLYYPAFICGCFVASFYEKIIEVDHIILNVTGLLGNIAIVILLRHIECNISVRTIVWFVWFVMIWFMIPKNIFAKIENIRRFTASSFIIYTTHAIILPIIYDILPGQSTRIYISQVLLTVLIGVGIYYLLRSACPKVLSALSGNR